MSFVVGEIIPFVSLPGGMLRSPWGETFIGVKQSQRELVKWIRLFSPGGMLPDPYWQAQGRVNRRAEFDPICGHWLTNMPIQSDGYCYANLTVEGKKLKVGIHALARIVLGEPIPVEACRNGKSRRAPVDHRCYYRPCFNPWHTAWKTTGENTRAGVITRQDLELHQSGYIPLLHRDELAP